MEISDLEIQLNLLKKIGKGDRVILEREDEGEIGGFVDTIEVG